MTPTYSSRTADKFVVRLPDGMRERIQEVAKDHHRSMNSEIIARLETSLAQEEGIATDSQLRIDSPEITVRERELLKAFRMLNLRKQAAIVSLIGEGE